MSTPCSLISVRTVIERVVADTRRRLAGVTTPSPAYAVGLYSPDPADLFPLEVLVGLESSRAAALRSMGPINAFYATWNAAEFGWNANKCGVAATESGLESDDGFARLQAAAHEELERQGHWDAQRYALLRVAAELSLRPPLAEVTEDFVCFLFDGDMGEDLITGIEFSATEHSKQQLRAKGLLPSDVSSLGTYEDWRQEGRPNRRPTWRRAR